MENQVKEINLELELPFWQEIRNKSKKQIEEILIRRLGIFNEEDKKESYVFEEIVKKLFYCFKNREDEKKRNFTYHLIQDKIVSIQEKNIKKGPKIGDVFYNISTENNLYFTILKDNLETENIWNILKDSSCINKTYLIKYFKNFKYVNLVNLTEINIK